MNISICGIHSYIEAENLNSSVCLDLSFLGFFVSYEMPQSIYQAIAFKEKVTNATEILGNLNAQLIFCMFTVTPYTVISTQRNFIL